MGIPFLIHSDDRMALIDLSSLKALSVFALKSGVILLALTLSVASSGCELVGSEDEELAAEDTTPPEPPKALSATSQDGAIGLHWYEVSDRDLGGYNIYRSISSIEEISGLDPLNSDKTVMQARYEDESAENGTTYHYVVTAFDRAGNESEASNQVRKTAFNTPPSRP